MEKPWEGWGPYAVARVRQAVEFRTAARDRGRNEHRGPLLLISSDSKPLPEGGRKYFGSLLVGYHSPEGLMYAGRVGTGFFGQDVGESLRKVSKAQGVVLPVYQLTREEQRQMGSWDYPGCHETLPVGQTCTGRPNKVYRVDA